MKRSVGNDGQSASALNARNPAFLVGFKVFSKGASAGPGTNPDTVVYEPSPHVLNPFVSDDARNSYGFVAGDSAFIVTITREFMLANLGHTGDHGLLEGFHDDVTPDDQGHIRPVSYYVRCKLSGRCNPTSNPQKFRH